MLLTLLALSAPGATRPVVGHNYDAVSDAVVGWTLEPGRSVTVAIALPPGVRYLESVRLRLRREAQPGVLQYRIGSRWNLRDIAAGTLDTTNVSPWFEGWQTIPVGRPRPPAAQVFVQLMVAPGSEGRIEVFGTSSAPINRPEFAQRFQYDAAWGGGLRREIPFENPINLDCGTRTAHSPAGIALDDRGTPVEALSLAFQLFDRPGEADGTEERFAFIREITGPLDLTGMRDNAVAPKPGEILLDGMRPLAAPAGAGPVVTTAVREFNEFIAGPMAVSVSAHTSYSWRVEIGCRHAMPEPEAFRLQAGPDEVVICASDERGVMQALHVLEAQMRLRRAPILAMGEQTHRPVWPVRITTAPFGAKSELVLPVDPYTPGLLARISRGGFNGIWIWGEIDQVAHSEVFPELDHGVATRQRRLNDLVARAARYGIDVYVQLGQRPLPEAFFARNAGARGTALAAYDGVNVPCSSSPQVRQHVFSATRDLMTKVPGLRGVIFIVGGEGFMHCHTRKCTCPRCGSRPPDEVVAELARTVLAGVRAGRSDAFVALRPYSASYWAKGDPVQAGLLSRLPPGLTLLTEFEKETPVSYGSVTIPAYDYTISQVGPAPRFVAQAALARRQQLGLWAKTEHAIALEFVQVPHIPVFFQWAERFRRIRATAGVSGVFANWMHYGFMPTIASEVFAWSVWSPELDAGELLGRIASGKFGAAAAPAAVRAWGKFSAAVRAYPFSGPMAMGVIQQGPAHPLFFDPQYQPHYGRGRQFQNSLRWTQPWGPELALAQLRELQAGWTAGVAEWEQVVELAQPWGHIAARRELGVARSLAACITSAIHVGEFYQLRDTLDAAQDRASVDAVLDRMVAVAQAELQNARVAREFTAADSRIGYANSGNAEAIGVPRGGIYSPGSIARKIAQVERLLREEIPAYRAARRRPAP